MKQYACLCSIKGMYSPPYISPCLRLNRIGQLMIFTNCPRVMKIYPLPVDGRKKHLQQQPQLQFVKVSFCFYQVHSYSVYTDYR